MNATKPQIARLERINYEANQTIAQITPGLEVCLSDDVIITSNEFFPYPDVTHACLLRATPQNLDNLIDEVINYFRAKSLPSTIFVSPACTPPDLAGRLVRRGFVKQDEEAWLALENLPAVAIPALYPNVTIQRVTQADLPTFVRVFLSAFDLPADFAPFIAQLTEPSLTLAGVYHFLAFSEAEAVGTCSLICFRQVGILGSLGVVRSYRGSRAVANLGYTVARQARQQGVDTLLLQTAAGTPLERLLRLSGFKRMFTRTAYTLNSHAAYD
jgi:hypothetical protein